MVLLSCFILSAQGRGGLSPIVGENSNARLKSPITLKAQNASLPEVLKVLAARSGMNFVAGQGVRKEKITIILDKTPLDEVINLVVRAAGLSYEIIGNSVLIAESGKLKDEVGFSSYVVRLKYAKAEEVAGMLSDLSKTIKVDKGGNRLMCYTSPRVINEIERIVKSIDHPHVQVLLETKLVEVSVDKLNEAGIDWANITPIMFSAKHPEVSLKKGYNVNNWKLGGLDINSAIKVLSGRGDARVLMDSKLTTTNNRAASLHIGEVIPYVIQSYNMSGSGGANQQIQKEEVGVKLSVVPHVNDDDEITLTIEPEVSSIIGWKGKNSDIPLVRRRRTKTTVRVKDGQTVFLAGLLSEEKTLEIKKLPILGDIPILGRLFQLRKEVNKENNMILEITPSIIKKDFDDK